MASNFSNGLNVTNGSVGIGTTTPQAKLDVNGTARIGGEYIPGNPSSFQINLGNAGVTIPINRSAFIASDGKNMSISNQMNGSLSLATNNSDAITILPSGNVGIGTNTPSQKLDVNGNVKIAGTLNVPTVYTNVINPQSNGDVTIIPSTSAAFVIKNSDTNVTQMILQNDATNNNSGTKFTIATKTSEWGIYTTCANGTNPGAASTFQIYSYFNNTNKIVMTLYPTGNVNIDGTLSTSGIINTNSGIRLTKTFGNSSGRPPLTPTNTISSFIIHGGGSVPGNNDGFLQLSAGGGTGTDTMSYIQLSGYSDSNLASDMDKNIVFGTAGTERMRINNIGNVGIGTNTPSQKLDVNGNVKIVGTLNVPTVYTNVINPAYGNDINITPNSTGAFNITNSASNVTWMRLNNENNIGNNGTKFSFVTPSSEWVIYTTCAGGSNPGNSSTLQIQSYFNGVAKWVMTMQPDGNVGIGTTTPTQKLDVAGSANISGNLTVGGTITASNLSQYVPYNGATANLNMGSYSIFATDVTATSDFRLKNRISTLQNSLSTVLQMRGVSYYPVSSNTRKIGVIAQEVEKVLPEVVATDNSPEQYKSVAYGNIVGILIEAVKELSAKVDLLMAKNV